jgi:surface antigen
MVSWWTASAIRHLFRVVTLLTILGLSLGIGAPSVGAWPHQSHVITTNPYSANYGPPNCTWYAWQRLHDVEGIDFQYAPNADQWAVQATQPQAFWSERTHSYIQAQINTTPAAGDIMVLPLASAYAHPYHVAFVEAGPDTSGNFLVTQQSYGDTNSSHANAKPYPWAFPSTLNLQAVQAAEQGQARFIHFPGVTISPQPVDGAAIISQSVNQTVQPNQPFSLSFTERNTGTTTWSDSGGYQLICLLNCMSASSMGLGGNSVSPGQLWKFSLALTAPAAKGIYATVWAMEHSGIQFGDGPAFVMVSVKILPGGVWISPMDGQAVGDQLHFAAHAYPTHTSDPLIKQVNFTINWPGASSWKIACTVPPPAAGDIYSCDVNLKQLGVPFGQVQVSFDVYDQAGNVNLAPNGVHTLIYAPSPGATPTPPTQTPTAVPPTLTVSPTSFVNNFATCTYDTHGGFAANLRCSLVLKNTSATTQSLSWSATMNPPYYTISPSSGTIPPGQSVTITFGYINAAACPGGETLTIKGTANTVQIPIACTFVVTTPDAVNFDNTHCSHNGNWTCAITLTAPTQNPITTPWVGVVQTPTAGITITPNQGTLAPGASLQVTITIASADCPGGNVFSFYAPGALPNPASDLQWSC